MFYEVKILNAKGDIRKVVPASEVSKQYWKKIMNKMNIHKRKKLIQGQQSKIGKCV